MQTHFEKIILSMLLITIKVQEHTLYSLEKQNGFEEEKQTQS